MGIQINGNTDNISAVDGGLTVSDLELNQTGVSTFHSHLHVADQIIHLGDANSKIRFPAADTITAETAGSERLRIKSDGKIGINTVSPTYGMHLHGTTASSNAYYYAEQSTAGASAGFRLKTTGSHFSIYGATSGSALGIYDYNAGAERFTITSEGNVFIAETMAVNRPRIVLSAPNDGTNYRHLFGANLQVNSSGTFTTPTANISGGGWEYLSANSLNAHGNLRYLSAPDTNATSSTPLERFRITHEGKVGIGTDNPGVQLHILSSSTGLKVQRGNESFSVNANYGGQSHCAFELTNALSIRTGSGAQNERFRITSGGDVGIGITNPAAMTHIYDSTDTSSSTEQFRISGGDRTADTFETGFRFFTLSPSTNGNRHVRFTSNGNLGLEIQPIETSTGNAAPDRNIMLCPSGGKVLIGRTGASHSSSTMEILGSGAEAYLRISPNTNTGTSGVVFGTADDHSTGGVYYGGSDDSLTLAGHNNIERLRIDSSGRVIIGATNTTNASTNADNLVISGSGNNGITIVSTNSSYCNLFFSDGSSGSAPYSGYIQYHHGGNQLVFGANGALRTILYDKDGGTNHSVLLIGGGGTSNNHYNSINTASITFGGGNDIENYFLGVRRENYGGDYTKLDLRWHTGIRMGAQPAYGGVRFFNDEDLDDLKFSIMGGGDHVEAHTTFRPGANNTYNCGTSGRRWAQIWYYNANTTSDRNEKNTITESDLGLDFICKLKPVSYKWNQREGENADTKTHYGLISQDVEETVIESGKTLDDFGAIVKPEGDDPMGLSYNEFISPLVKAIQEQQEQIKILQEKIASLEGS